MNQKVTIYTLAEELHVSPSAVSRAFNPTTRLNAEKRAKILALAEKYNFSPNRAAARLSRKEIKIGVLIINRIPAFYQPMYEGILAGEKEHSTEKVTADIRMLPPDDNAGTATLETLEEFKNKHYDGIIVHGLYSQEIVMKINELTDNGIPVVTLHNDLPASRRLFNSTSNTSMTGAMAAELLKGFIPSKEKRVVLFTGSMSSQIHQQLFLSFSNACRSEGLLLLQSYDTLDVPAFAEHLVEEAFETYPDLNGIYVSSANSLAICEYLKQHDLGGKVALITSDVFSELNDYIRAGIVSASLYQDPFKQGKNAFVNLYRHIVERVTLPQIILSNTQIVLKSNLSLFE